MNAKWSRGDVCLQCSCMCVCACACMCEGRRGKRVPGKGGGGTDRGEEVGEGDVRGGCRGGEECRGRSGGGGGGGGSKESATTAANPNPLPPPPRYWCHLSPRK